MCLAGNAAESLGLPLGTPLDLPVDVCIHDPNRNQLAHGPPL